MSKMGELLYQIEEYVERGYEPQYIAEILDCSIDWVEDIWEQRALLERDMQNYYSHQED